jgi:NCAIR mutase (PurE)-related protein
MELFASATTEKTTNTIHLYDIAPKFTYNRRERDVSESAFDRRAMKVANEEYEVEVQAARIKRDGGEEVLIYPGEREECIEDSLRKLATSGNGVFLNGEAGVRFSLYQLKQDLDRHNHTYSWPQLR